MAAAEATARKTRSDGSATACARRSSASCRWSSRWRRISCWKSASRDRLADQLQPFSRLREKSLPPRRRGWRDATDEGAFRKAAPSPQPLSRFAGEGLRSEEHTSELQSLMRISYAVFCLNTKTNKRDAVT